MSVASGTCHYHPQRPGIGICVECRQVVCQECTTQFEGINRCAACLARLARREHAPRARHPFRAGAVIGTFVCFAAVYLTVYGLGRLVSP